MENVTSKKTQNQYDVIYGQPLYGLGRNSVLQWKKHSFSWNKSNFTLKQIQIHNGSNTISHWTKSNFRMEQSIFILEKIQLIFEPNQIAHWNESNLTLKQIQLKSDP